VDLGISFKQKFKDTMSREICEDRSQVEALHGKPEEAEVAAVVQLLKWSLHFPTKYVLKIM
jgi:hypothetical protein